jgi:hypothetical protein
LGTHFDFAGRNFFVNDSFGTESDGAGDLHDIFGMERPHGFGEFFVVFLQKDDLCESVSVAQVDEEYAAVISHGVDPAGESYRLTVMFFPKFAAGFGS